MRPHPFVMMAVVMLVSSGRVLARPLVAADRFVTLQHGEVEVALDAALGLSSGATGREMALDTGYRHDRHGGLSVAVGVLDSIEVGTSVSVIKWSQDAGSEFGGIELYGAFGFLPFLGLEAGVLVSGFSQGRDDVTLHPALRLGVPFRFTVVEGVFAVFSRTDFLLGFRRDSSGFEWFTDVGCTVNVTPWFFVEGYGGISRSFRGGRVPLFGGTATDAKPLAVPAGAGVGVTLLERLDVFASFNLEDVKEARTRNITLSVAARL